MPAIGDNHTMIIPTFIHKEPDLLAYIKADEDYDQMSRILCAEFPEIAENNYCVVGSCEVH